MNPPRLIPAPTQRLAFRQMTADDLDDMAALLGDPEVMRYYPPRKTETRLWPGSIGTSASTGKKASGSG